MTVKNIYQQVLHKEGRSADAIRNILLSMFSRGVSILCSLLVVPLTINYLNPTKYGIWLTLSSIIAWISFFDLGFGNGFRNKFAEARASENHKLAHSYVSTTYFIISLIVSAVFVVLAIVNNFLDWTSILKLDAAYKDELKVVFWVLSFFFCINMVVNIFSTLLTADQKPGVASIINGLASVVSLGAIFLLTKLSSGSLLKISVFYSSVPCIVMLISSIIAYHFTRYKDYRPDIKTIDVKLVRNILSLGIRFFLIYICMLVIFQVINIVVSRELGPESVTQYNLAFKYFDILHKVMIIVITPFWSAFTDAYVKKDYEWMKRVVKKLEIVWFYSIIAGVVMLALSGLFFKVWIGDSVVVPFVLCLGMMLYIEAQILGAIYMHLINGIGTIKIQFITYVVFAVISLPVLTYACRFIGIQGVIILPAVVYFAQAILGKVQISKILSNNAVGLWGK